MLILLPNVLSQGLSPSPFLPKEIVLRLEGLIAESEKGGRRFLSYFFPKEEAFKLPLTLLNEHTAPGELEFLLEPLLKGQTWGVVSDSGLPCLADPGSALVYKARLKKIPIVALPGPSSLFLALMLSGLPAQRFAFHGYPHRDAQARKLELQKWERQSKEEGATHLFIETPYRNQATLASCLETLKETTLLSVSWDLMGPEEKTLTLKVGEWKKRELPALAKKPAVFLLFN